MGAKDTVMNDTLIQVWVLEFIQPGELDLNAKLKEFAQAQAEITWSVAKSQGIREVVEWINKTFSKTITIDQMMATNTWQANLKEWGIE